MRLITRTTGCNELIFNPLIEWWRKGPISKQLRIFVWSGAPVHYKISMMACSYRAVCRTTTFWPFLQTCSHIVRLTTWLHLVPSEAFLDGIAAAAILTLLNYLILGFQIQIDGFFLHSFEIWLACTVVFPGLGNLGFTLLEYRLGHRSLLSSLAENLTWIPFLWVPVPIASRPGFDENLFLVSFSSEAWVFT